MNTNNGFFVTGTDTDAGKTFVSSLILRAMAEAGLNVAGLKPIASGFDCQNGSWVNADVQALTDASNVELPAKRVNRYAFRPAIAPHIAAKQAGCDINIDDITCDVAYAINRTDAVLVEGVGGWHVPLQWPDFSNSNKSFVESIRNLNSHATAKKTNAICNIENLAVALDLPVILVVGMRLGCLNHALLSAQAILASGLPLIGWVANCIDPDFDCLDENLATLEALLPVPKLFEVPFIYENRQLDVSFIKQAPFIQMLCNG